MINQVISFFKAYNINIENDDIIIIKDVKIPNFYKKYSNNKIIQWEFCHLLYKIYSNYFINGTTFYENNLYKISNKDIIFDCGANMGLFSAYAAAQGAQVYAFEPMSFTRSLLEETAKLYPNNIHIQPFALKNEKCTKVFVQCDNLGASHDQQLLVNFENKIMFSEQVNCISLDYFIQNTNIIPTFLKIDVEGSEEELIVGAEKLLQKYKPVLSMGLYHENNNNNITFLIKNYNFLYNLYFFLEKNGQGLYLFSK